MSCTERMKCVSSLICLFSCMIVSLLLTVAWIIAKNTTILEASITVDLGFRISRGDQSVRTRAFAYTDGGSATPGELSQSCMYASS